MRLGGGKRRARFVLPALYLLFALYMWVDFVLAPPDGLANVGLFLATLPVALVGLVIDTLTDSARFSLLPDGFGYLGNHALYFVPAVLLTAMLFYALGRKIDRRGRA